MKTSHIILCALFLSIFPHSAHAEARWETFIEGISIYDLALDGRYIWCAAPGTGIIKFDTTDNSSVTYTTEDGLPSNDVLSVSIDHNGLKWFGFIKGICSFDGSVWQHYSNEELGIDDSSNLGIFKIGVDHDNVMWFVSDMGIFTFDSIAFKRKNSQSYSFGDVAVDTSNIVWCCGEGILSRFVEGVEYRYSREEMLIDDHILRYIRAIAVDDDYRVWVGGEYLAQFINDEWEIYTEDKGYVFNDGELDDIVCIEIENGIIWIGTYEGLWSYDGEVFTLYNGDYLRFQPYIMDFEIDENGNIWAAGASKGGAFHGLIQYITNKVSVDDRPKVLALDIATSPNPFNASTTLSYTLPAESHTTLTIYDITGRKVRELVSGEMPAGRHTALWDGRGENGVTVSSGIYLSQLRAGGMSATARMLFLK